MSNKENSLKSKYLSDFENQWCPGCGNFAILKAMVKAFETLDLTPEEIMMVGGIGQSGKTPHYLNCNMFHGLHGRALPVATGIKMANHDMNVIVSSGDGDCYGEGGNHMMAAIRRNVDLTVFVHNNQVYGLTKGQASPTSQLGMKTKLQQQGVISNPFSPIPSILVAGAGFVAQGFSGNIEQLSELMVEAISYKGFSLIDIFQPCVSFNKINTHLWYKERVYDLAIKDHDYTDYETALKVAHSGPDRIPTGIIYKTETIPFDERLAVLKKMPLIHYGFDKTRMDDILNSL